MRRCRTAVSSSNSLAAWWRWLLRALGDRPWVWITAVLLAVVAGARGFRQRFVVTIGRRTGP